MSKTIARRLEILEQQVTSNNQVEEIGASKSTGCTVPAIDDFVGWHEVGEASGKGVAQWKIANEMRVLFCALVTAHKREDSLAFWATVAITKSIISKYANFDDEDWDVFRSDIPRKEIVKHD